MFSKMRAVSATAGVICALALMATGASGLAAAAKPKPQGKHDSGTSYVAVTHTAGGFEYSAGNNSDKLLGVSAVTYRLKAGATQTGSILLTSNPVVLYTATGTLRGTGSATLTVRAGGAATVTGGKINLNKGTGSLRGHSLVATFTGSGNATTGQYVFHYTGTFR